MAAEHQSLPTWILIVSGFFALMELVIGVTICISPQSVVETVDLNAGGVEFLTYMWGSRQFALGSIFAYATYKRSVPMLTLAYIFFLVMFVGDLLTGIVLKENSLVIGAVVMGLISSVMIYRINKKK